MTSISPLSEIARVSKSNQGISSKDSIISRPPRQNFNRIHSLPIPLVTYPLPAFIPHNPLSILRVVYAYVSQAVSPPSSHPLVPYRAYFSIETRCLHVTDSSTARALWEKGFFGKGSLSRSEPSWLNREKQRQGYSLVDTSEEVTRRRRDERKRFKEERAKKEREAIERTLQEERSGAQSSAHRNLEEGSVSQLNEHIEGNGTLANNEADLEGESKLFVFEPPRIQSTPLISTPRAETEGEILSDSTLNDTEKGLKSVRFSPVVQEASPAPQQLADIGLKPKFISQAVSDAPEIRNEEHLQLSLEEAFFLAYGLGVLEVYAYEKEASLSIDELLSIFRQHSHFPPCPSACFKPDDPFLLSYVAYHHFRSLGWVVRSGVKFAVDYLLYNRGPVFSHAEFAVIVLPSYSHPYYSRFGEQGRQAQQKQRSWWWLHSVSRVQSQVRKTLVLAYVEVPPPEDITDGENGQAKDNKLQLSPQASVVELLRGYRVREFILKRWIPNRNRD